MDILIFAFVSGFFGLWMGFHGAVVQIERRHPTGFRHPASANQFSVVMVTVKLQHRTCDTHTYTEKMRLRVMGRDSTAILGRFDITSRLWF